MIRFDFDQGDWSQGQVDVIFDGDDPIDYPYPDGTLEPLTPDKIVVHWGGNTDPDGPDDVATVAEEQAILRGWQRYHIFGRGWTDIAYGYAFGNSGTTSRLRGLNRQGATSGDLDDDGVPENHEAISLVWIGGAQGSPTDAAYRALARLIGDIHATFGPLPVTVHRDHKATACPGDELTNWVRREGWLDYPTDEEEPMTDQQWFDTLRERDIERMYDVGIIDRHEADYWLDVKQGTKQDDPMWLRNAVRVRSPLYV